MASNLISRSDLLTRMCQENCGERQCVDAMDRCVWYNYIKQQPTVDRWIPCSERLPKEEGMYLITSNLFGSLEVQYVFYSENVQMFVCNGTPVAWMPLPSPYKAGDIDG